MNTRISIIIPVYQQGEYLEDAIESAYNQTKSPHEIIIINDGSTDDTQEIAERYMFKDFPLIESPVKVINQVNKGLPSARNTGIMATTGDYCLFLDADDILRDNAISTFTKEIIETNADIIAPSFVEFGKSNREVIIQPFSMEDLKVANRLGYFGCIRRSALIECGGYSPKMKWGYEDYHLWFDLFRRGKSIAPIKDVLVAYRIKEKSMIHTANEHADELHAQIRKDFPHLFT
jgi:cellulose synthase/poly-beta-1,6-N-acetylglucosamine synthase-like glycosyltransferase